MKEHTSPARTVLAGFRGLQVEWHAETTRKRTAAECPHTLIATVQKLRARQNGIERNGGRKIETSIACTPMHVNGTVRRANDHPQLKLEKGQRFHVLGAY